MAFIIYCGEQDIEDDGICISMQIQKEENDTPDVIFINIVDNLLGVSEFITSSGYKYAQVSIDYDREGLDCTKYSNFGAFVELSKNNKIKELLHKYVEYQEEEPVIEDGVIWYCFVLNNMETDMSDEDILEFTKIFKERTKSA